MQIRTQTKGFFDIDLMVTPCMIDCEGLSVKSTNMAIRNCKVEKGVTLVIRGSSPKIEHIKSRDM